MTSHSGLSLAVTLALETPKSAAQIHTQLSTTKHCGVHHYTTMHTFMLSGGSPSPVVAATNTANFCSTISHAIQLTGQLPPFTKQYQRPPHNLSTPHQAVVQYHNRPWPSQQAQILVEKHPMPVVPLHPATTHTPRATSAICVCVLWQAPHLCCSSLTAIQQQQSMSLWR